MRRARVTIAIAMLAAGIAAAAPAAAAGAGGLDPAPWPQAEISTPDGPDESLLDELALPPVSSSTVEAATAIKEQFGEDDRFSAIEVSRDRSTTTVFWHGEPTVALEAAASSAAFKIEDTAYLPGELRREASDLLEQGVGGLDLTSVAIPADASGLDVTVAQPDARARTAIPSELESNNGTTIRVIGTEAPVASSEREYDTYLMGGSRIMQFVPATSQITGRCTSGFAAHRHLPDGTKAYALITAAHCGPANSTWIIARGSWTNGGPFTNGLILGSMPTARAESRDGAAISTVQANPFSYVGASTASTYTGIDGVASPFVGAELCYSGSASGTVCGNIVQYVDMQYTLNNGLPGVTLTGNRAIQINGVPSSGNGDSGGPALLPTLSPSGTETVYASSIISAMFNPQPSCVGEPATNTRACGTDTVTTNVSNAASIMGWTVSTLSDY